MQKKSGRVNSIGIADLTEDKLRHICEWSSIAPDIHQVCLSKQVKWVVTIYFRFARSSTTARLASTQLSIWVTSIMFGRHHMGTYSTCGYCVVTIVYSHFRDPQGVPSKMTLDLDSLLDGTKLRWSTDFTGEYSQTKFNPIIV